MESRSNFSRNLGDGVDDSEINYHETASFLEEGEKNKKIDSRACLLVHNSSWYYVLDLTTSFLLLLLALVEKPVVNLFDIPVEIYDKLELIALTVIGIQLALELRWIGWTTILNHKCTTLKVITLVITVFEVLTVPILHSSRFRVTRALRPIFVIDTRASEAVGRFIRQIYELLPPILDMLVLLMFSVCSYVLLGYYLFSQHQINLNFKILSEGFASMFNLLPIANFPEAMMPSYAISKWNAIFFISYISTVLYVLINLMLIHVCETFSGVEEDKLGTIFVLGRKECQLAFRLLVSKQNPNTIRFKQFQNLMRYCLPRNCEFVLNLFYFCFCLFHLIFTYFTTFVFTSVQCFLFYGIFICFRTIFDWFYIFFLVAITIFFRIIAFFISRTEFLIDVINLIPFHFPLSYCIFIFFITFSSVLLRFYY